MKPIVLDDKFEESVQKYMNEFPEGSLNHLLAEFSPVPTSQILEDKFEYFYRPYNYICNVEKFINYDGEAIKGDSDPFKLYEEILSEEPYIDEFLRSKGMARSQSEPQRLM